ncbi:MAG: restriction endonuclease subunit S [Opitutales bacterium]|nr:restriction endonuclease subunit S [Opitutales bacterium]
MNRITVSPKVLRWARERAGLAVADLEDKFPHLAEWETEAAQPGISAEAIRALRIPVPPLPEQRAIAAYLDEETAKLDALVAKVETVIERLQEYRSALITAAVTGKIDARSPEDLRSFKFRIT